MCSLETTCREERLIRSIDGRSASFQSAIFVWGLWSALLALATRCVWQHGCRVPYIEDWYYIDLLTGKQQLSLGWLWQQLPRADHRVPLFKLLINLDYKIFGVDVRPFMYLDVLLAGILSAALIWAARRWRRETCYADAYLPIVLLNLGHAEAFLWAEASVYAITSFCAGLILTIMIATRGRLGMRSATVAGVSLVLLPLCFGGGVLYVPFLGLWLGFSGYRSLKSRNVRRRMAGRIAIFFTMTALVLSAAYLVGYKQSRFDEREESTAFEVGPGAVVKTSLKYLSMSFGPAVQPPIWPVSGAVVLGLLSVCGACLAVSMWWRGPSFRRGIGLGLSLFLIACLVTGLAVGLSRASWSHGYLFRPRYATSAAPFALGLYFVWEFCAPRRWVPLGRMVLFTLAASTLMLNTTITLNSELWRKPFSIAFENDVRNGMPIPLLVSKYASLTHHDHEKIEYYLKALRDARIGDYRYLPPDPLYRELQIPLDPVALNHVEWQGKSGRATGNRPYLAFDIGEPQFVCGLRIRYSSTNPEGLNPYFELFTRNSLLEADFGKRRYLHVDLPSDGREVDVPIWLFDTIDQIQIHPDKRPCDFTISSVTLLLPERDRAKTTSERRLENANK